MRTQLSSFAMCLALALSPVADAQTNSTPIYVMTVYSPTLKVSTNAAGLFRLATNMTSHSAIMDVQIGRKLVLELGNAGYVPAMLWLGAKYKLREDPEWNLGILLEAGHQGSRPFAKVRAPAGNVVLYEGENPFDVASVQWFRKAAQKGNADAQYALGQHFGSEALYQKPSEPATRESEISNDSPAAKEATQWYTLAANQGERRAMLRLAWHYSAGFGVPRNSGKAMQLYEKCEAFYDMAKLSLNNSNRLAALMWWGVGNARQKPAEAPFTSEYAAISFSLAEREVSAQRAALFLLQRYGSTNSISATQPKRSSPRSKPANSRSQTNQVGSTKNSFP